MQAEHPDEFAVDASGHFRRKTERELQADRRAAMLASGNWIEDPETGTLVSKDSRRGREVAAARGVIIRATDALSNVTSARGEAPAGPARHNAGGPAQP